MEKEDDFEKLIEYVDAYLALHEEYARKLDISIDELLEARAEWQSNRGI